MTNPMPTPLRNRLLARLPPAELQRVLPHLREVSLRHGETIYEVEQEMEFVYFPTQCVLSALTVVENGNAIEVGTIGHEGAAGLLMLTGTSISLHRVVSQVPGACLRMGADVLLREASRSEPLRDQLQAYQAYFFAQVSQSVACNGLHAIQQRCCRWLLMTHDRLDSDVLPLTHEFLAMMLGVRRAGVTELLQSLQEKGVVNNRRGKITVTNRQGLEELSCECYREVKRIYDRLVG